MMVTVTDLSISPLCFSISVCDKWYEDLTVADSIIESILPVNTTLDLMYILSKQIHSISSFSW